MAAFHNLNHFLFDMRKTTRLACPMSLTSSRTTDRSIVQHCCGSKCCGSIAGAVNSGVNQVFSLVGFFWGEPWLAAWGFLGSASLGGLGVGLVLGCLVVLGGGWCLLARCIEWLWVCGVGGPVSTFCGRAAASKVPSSGLVYGLLLLPYTPGAAQSMVWVSWVVRASLCAAKESGFAVMLKLGLASQGGCSPKYGPAQGVLDVKLGLAVIVRWYNLQVPPQAPA
ncbi:hypothetical protein U1Q18_029746 [Sarracenia purpurea var. burkii]